MSSIPHKTENGNEIFDSATKFLKEFQVGKLLFQCNAGKMKGIPVMDIFRYLFCLIFSDRSMYMQRKTGVFIYKMIDQSIGTICVCWISSISVPCTEKKNISSAANSNVTIRMINRIFPTFFQEIIYKPPQLHVAEYVPAALQ